MIIPPASLLTSRSTAPDIERVRSKVPGSDPSPTHVPKTSPTQARRIEILGKLARCMVIAYSRNLHLPSIALASPNPHLTSPRRWPLGFGPLAFEHARVFAGGEDLKLKAELADVGEDGFALPDLEQLIGVTVIVADELIGQHLALGHR